MAGSVNKVILVGNLGKDPETRQAQNGNKIVSFNIATGDTWTDKNSGEKKERTEWHRIVVFNERIAEVAERFLKKGAKVYIEGSLQTRKWMDQSSGQEKFTTEVVIDRFRGELTMLSGRKDGDEGDEGEYSSRRPSNGNGSGARQQTERGGGGGAAWDSNRRSNDLDDEIPFCLAEELYINNRANRHVL